MFIVHMPSASSSSTGEAIDARLFETKEKLYSFLLDTTREIGRMSIYEATLLKVNVGTTNV